VPGAGEGAGRGGIHVAGIEDGTAPLGNGLLVGAGPDDGSVPGRVEDVPASLRAFVRRYLESIRAAGEGGASTAHPSTRDGERR
jgi:hypothetical protein